MFTSGKISERCINYTEINLL